MPGNRELTNPLHHKFSLFSSFYFCFNAILHLLTELQHREHSKHLDRSQTNIFFHFDSIRFFFPHGYSRTSSLVIPHLRPSLSSPPPSLPSILHSARQTIKASFSVADPLFTLTSAPSPVADGGVSYSPHGSKRGARWALDSEPDFGSCGQLAELWLSGYRVVQAEHNA